MPPTPVCKNLKGSNPHLWEYPIYTQPMGLVKMDRAGPLTTLNWAEQKIRAVGSHQIGFIYPNIQHNSTARTISISICLFFFFFKLCVSVSLSMEALSSPLYLTPRPRHSCPLKWCSSGSVLLFPPCLKTPAKHNNMGIIKASVAVEQQTQKTITALIRIGTRGRYSFSLLFSSLLQLS